MASETDKNILPTEQSDQSTIGAPSGPPKSKIHWPWSAPLSDDHPDIEPLTPANVRDLRLPWLSRFNTDTLRTHLEVNPGKSLWAPRTGEYVLGERWRKRDDIANIAEVTARKGKAALVRATLDLMRTGGAQLVLLSDEAWNDQPRLYADLGFERLEKIVLFGRELSTDEGRRTKDEGMMPELSSFVLRPSSFVLPHLDYSQATLSGLDLLLQLDHNSFPWLWWNCQDEMGSYLLMDNVFVYIAHLGDEPIGYASFTMYNGWAHLDRLAVVEAQQGRRYGAAQLLHTLQAMIELGAGHVGLSTQEQNVQSHRLYKGFGFKQTRDYVYIYGKRVTSEKLEIRN